MFSIILSVNISFIFGSLQNDKKLDYEPNGNKNLFLLDKVVDFY